MIHDHERSGWFGASDTGKIVGSWETPTFEKWWMVKLGIRQENFTTDAMLTGTAFEHRILEHIGIRKMDRQIRISRLRLRINLDGETKDEISEVKTYGKDHFVVSKAYWQQCQVEMFGAKKQCRIVAYHLLPEDYLNWFSPIDDARISYYPIQYDAEWVKTEYLPRLIYLSNCLKKGVWPNADEQRTLAAGQ